MNNIITVEKSPLDQFKTGVDSLLDRRKYFMNKILPTLRENVDYYVIKGRKSLSKQGAETLCAIYGLKASFEKDSETLSSFKNVDDAIAYKCTLQTRDGNFAGEGRGASTLKQNDGNINRCLKIATKSSFIDACIRTTGLSGLFTQDLETIPLTDISPALIQSSKPIPSIYTAEIKSADPYDAQREWDSGGEEESKDEPQPDFDNPMTEKQRSYLTSLICEKCSEPAERERWLSEVESCDKFGASAMIGEFLSAVPRY